MSEPRRVSVHTIYRVGVWLPLIVPLLVGGAARGLGVLMFSDPLQKVAQILLISLVYGGLPYAALAAWATWWIDSRPEPEIRRLMFRAPLLMAATFLACAVVVGVLVGQPVMFLAVGALGAIVSVLLGYVYVAFVMLLRDEWGPQPAAVQP